MHWMAKSLLFFTTTFLLLYLSQLPHNSAPTMDRFASKIAGKLGDKFGLDLNKQSASGSQPQAQAQAQGPGLPVAISSADHVLHESGGTYPRLCRLADGAILLGITKFEGPTRVLAVHRSTDNGRTFAPWGEVTRCDGDCDNMYLLELPPTAAGPAPPKILAAFRNHDVDHHRNRDHTRYRITVCQSHDGGRAWTYCSQAFEKFTVPNGLWEPFMRIGRQGEIQMTFSQELEHCDQDTMM